MPRFSVWAIKAALIHLCVGFTLGAVLLAHKGAAFFPPAWMLLPLHIETLLVGWTLQLILGVAFWILPRFKHAPKRGNETLVLLAIFLLNSGVVMVGLSVLLPLRYLVELVGRTTEVLAIALFAVHAWPRVKPSGA